MSLTIDDISTAAFLSRAAYNDKVIGTATTASANIAAQGANLAGWQYVSPTALEFGISASLVDQFGYFSLGTGASQQALLAYNPGTHTLAIAFRGTAGLTDLIIDLYGGLAGFGLVYQPFETFLVSKVLSGATSFGANRILVTGHSLGGAMAELMMSRHADTGALSFSAVTFGSPGTSDIIGNSSGSDARLLNIGHVDLETAVGTSLVTAYLQGDPVYRASVNEHILGSDIRVNQPYERDGYLDQHDSEQYQKTASAISRELTQNLQDSHPFNVREFSYVRATTPTDNYLSGNDNKNVVIGNSGHQSLIGRGGADILDGLEGNDTIFGDGGNDTLYGGSGSDLLYGGENDDVLHTSDTDDLLDGEEGNDRYVVKYTGGASTSTQIRDISGIDVLEILASTADPSKTRFLVAGNDLVVEVHGTSNQLLTTVAIRNNSNTAAVETLRLTYTGGFVASYDLQASLESAQAGISLSPPPTLADDFDGSAATTAVFSVGGSINGKLENSNDRDAFQVNLIAGRTYQFDLKGAATGSGTLVDPYMTLRDAAFTVLAEDDNTGIGANAQITHTATRTGLYFIRVGSANLATGTGTYNVFATQTSLTPVNSNSAPVVVGAGQAFSAGTVVAASTLFRGIDSDGDAIVSYIINDAPGSGYFQLGGVRQPEGSSFTVNATQYNNLQFVVGAGGTSDIFLVQASDGRAYGADNSVTIVGLSNVTPPPAVLTAQNDTATVVAGSQIVLNVLNNDNRALVRITDLQSAPNYITIRPGSEDAIIITPPNWFTGSFTFGYTATDGKGASASATVALTVAAPIPTNHAPEVQNVTRTLENNQQPQFDLLYNTYDADGETAQLTLQGYSSPSHGILARSGSVVTYTPSIGYVGSDGFSFVIQDPHGAQTSATVSLTVVQPAKAVDDVISTAVNTPIEFNVLQNDQYSNSNLFYLYGPPTTPGPQHGTVTFAQDGKFTYTPTPGYVGVDSFVYRIYYLTGYSTLSSGYVTLSVGDSGQQGTAGPDILNGSSANDAILGGGGDDTLWGGAGNDILDGGTGFDIVSFAGAPIGITVSLEQPYTNGLGTINWDDPYFWSYDGLGGRDSIRNIEGVIGSEFNDSIRGNNSANFIVANGGNDSIYLMLGNDTAYGGDGNDLIQSGNNDATARVTAFGGTGNDTISGNVADDLIEGGPGDDLLYGFRGNNTVLGQEGNDRLYGVGFSDGGDGDDWISTWGDSGEPIAHSNFVGGNGQDTLIGGPGNDTLEGGEGNDSLYGSQGSDRMDGGNGFDIAYFGDEPFGTTIDLASGFAQTSRGFDTLISIESVIASRNAADNISGSANADSMDGDYGNDTLIGRGGVDSILGNSGDDRIQGDEGADLLTGGTGADSFVYLSASDKGDTITDFTVGTGGDVLNLAALLASSGYSGTTPGFDGFLRLVSSGSDTLIQFDPDGKQPNASFDTLATLRGVNPTTLTAANFSTTVDIATLIATIPTSFRIEVLNAILKPGTSAPAVLEGDSGSSPLVIRFIREGNVSSALSAAISFEIGSGLNAADFVGGLPANQNITFSAGQSTYDLTLNVIGDTVFEADEKLSVSITAATAANSPTTSMWILTEENLIDGDGALVGTVRADSIVSHDLADFILSDSGDDKVVSGGGNDFVDAGEGNDSVDAGSGVDRLQGSGGNDTLSGAGGRDTSIYSVTSTSATKTHNADDTWTVNAGVDGNDTLRNIEILQFSDRKVVIEDPQTDFNADGNSDLLWFRQSDGYAYLWTMTNNVQSGGNAIGQIGTAWTIQTTGDFNGDGSSDFVWKNTSTGQFYLWNFTNGIQSGGANIGVIGTNWNVMGSGDFNADGTGDIVWRDSNTSQLYLWMMQNNAIASSTNLGSIGVDWTVQAVGDFNGDGTSDLALRNTATGQAYLWNFTNGTLSGGNNLGNIPNNWTIMGSGDFNADGTDDLAWRNSADGKLILWMMQNNSISSTSDLGTIGTQWTIDAISDVNADGSSDLLLKNSSSGQFYIWDITNGVVSGGADLGLIGADWQLV